MGLIRCMLGSEQWFASDDDVEDLASFMETLVDAKRRIGTAMVEVREALDKLDGGEARTARLIGPGGLVVKLERPSPLAFSSSELKPIFAAAMSSDDDDVRNWAKTLLRVEAVGVNLKEWKKVAGTTSAPAPVLALLEAVRGTQVPVDRPPTVTIQRKGV